MKKIMIIGFLLMTLLTVFASADVNVGVTNNEYIGLGRVGSSNYQPGVYFTNVGGDITSVRMYFGPDVGDMSSSTGVTLYLKTGWTGGAGTILAVSDTIPQANIIRNGWNQFNFSTPVTLSTSGEYHTTMGAGITIGTDQYFQIAVDTSDTFPNSGLIWYDSAGTGWTYDDTKGLVATLVGVDEPTECGSVPIDNCYVSVNTTFTPGTYILPNGITIAADGVTLDMNGAVIKGDGTVQNAAGVKISYHNDVTITDGTFQDYYYDADNTGRCIEFNYADNLTLTNVNVNNCDLMYYGWAINNDFHMTGGTIGQQHVQYTSFFFNEGTMLEGVRSGEITGITTAWGSGTFVIPHWTTNGDYNTLLIHDNYFGDRANPGGYGLWYNNYFDGTNGCPTGPNFPTGASSSLLIFYNNTFDTCGINQHMYWDDRVDFCYNGISNNWINGAQYTWWVGDALGYTYNGFDVFGDFWAASCPESFSGALIDWPSTTVIVSEDQTQMTVSYPALTPSWIGSMDTTPVHWTEWFIDGVNQGNFSGTSHTFTGLTPYQTYNISFTAYLNESIKDTHTLEATAEFACVNPVSDMVITSNTIFCAGNWPVRHINIQNGADVTFEPGTHLYYNPAWMPDGCGDPFWNDCEEMITVNGDNSVIDCNGGDIEGYYQGNWGDPNFGGTRGYTSNGNYNELKNCNVYTHGHPVFVWATQVGHVFDNIEVYDSMGAVIHGPGTNGTIINSRLSGGLIGGENILIDNLSAPQGGAWGTPWLSLGHPGAAEGTCCEDFKFSGTIRNSQELDLEFDAIYENSYVNITNNQIWWFQYYWDWFQETDNTEIYVYGNQIDEIYDPYDYSSGINPVWCVDGVGNGFPYYEGLDPNQGTCPRADCSVSFEPGCEMSSNVDLSPGIYNAEDLLVTGDTLTLDCHGATIRGSYTNEFGTQSNFAEVNGVDFKVQNCVFEDFYTLFKVDNGPRDGLWLENIEWSEDIGEPICNDPWVPMGTPFDQETCNDLWFEYPEIVGGSLGVHGLYIMNSDFSGTIDFDYNSLDQTYTWYGDYCADSNGDYVPNSDMCSNWDYDSNGATEEQCAPGMWNSGLGRCEDSRFRYAGGNCIPNGCSGDFKYFEGYWFACDWTGQFGDLRIIGNTIDKSAATFPSKYRQRYTWDLGWQIFGGDNVQVRNNNLIGFEQDDQGGFQIMRLSGTDDSWVTGNDITSSAGFNMMPLEWGTPMCYNKRMEISNNNFDFTTKNSFYANWLVGVDGLEMYGNTFDLRGSPAYGVAFYIGNDGGDISAGNMNIHDNDIYMTADPADYQHYYAILTSDWSGTGYSNVQIHDNNIYDGGVYIRTSNWVNSTMHDNNLEGVLLTSMYDPDTEFGMDLCANGLGNNYGDIWWISARNQGTVKFNPLCEDVTIPNGILVSTVTFQGNETRVNIDGNGVTIKGTGAVGLDVQGNPAGPTFFTDATIENLGFSGFTTSVTAREDTVGNLFNELTLSSPYLDLGVDNLWTNIHGVAAGGGSQSNRRYYELYNVEGVSTSQTSGTLFAIGDFKVDFNLKNIWLAFLQKLDVMMRDIRTLIGLEK